MSSNVNRLFPYVPPEIEVWILDSLIEILSDPNPSSITSSAMDEMADATDDDEFFRAVLMVLTASEKFGREALFWRLRASPRQPASIQKQNLRQNHGLLCSYS